MKLDIDPQFTKIAPDYCGIILKAFVKNAPTSDALWEEMVRVGNCIRSIYPLDEVNKRPAIAAMRQLYKKLGKDPNRYRPSAEALSRRVVMGKSLYRINTLVDIINLVSLQSGFSIGGFDNSRVVGPLSISVGKSGELFNAIGRGQLNIAGLPVYKDVLGCIGTPTSDEERTKLSVETTDLLMVIHSADGDQAHLDIASSEAQRLLTTYASAAKLTIDWF
jgi:DNA/RNA-binding domain of Phe-tRNA-synthetase-like protein